MMLVAPNYGATKDADFFCTLVTKVYPPGTAGIWATVLYGITYATETGRRLPLLCTKTDGETAVYLTVYTPT